jgi:phosphohistidine phosphatase SixA
LLRLVVLILLVAFPGAASATDAGWALLREGGHVVLLRHARINGTAEPSNFKIDDCSTQRNLTGGGKQQAGEIGALIAARSAPIDRVLSSRYCRCLDTARIAFEDEPEPFAPLDPPDPDPTKRAVQTEAVLKEIRGFSGSGNMVMVTNLENIQEWTGISPREGEAVIVEPEAQGLRVLGRVTFN